MVVLDRPWASLDQQVTATVEALDAHELERPILIGHSAGAEVAMATAVANPDRIRALVLLAPVVGRGAPRLVSAIARLPGTEVVAPSLLRAGTRFLGPILRSASADTTWLTPDVVEGYSQPLRAPGVAESLWAMTAAGAGSGDLVADTSGLPCLVIAGRVDRWFTPVTAPADTVLLDGCGHLPHEEQPERVVSEIERFLCELHVGE